MPDFLVSDCRDQPDDGLGPARIGVLRSGLVFEQIGTDISDGGGDVGQLAGIQPANCVRRYFGQIWAGTKQAGGAHFGAIRPYDEGGTDDWHATAADKTAKGGSGVDAISVIEDTFPVLVEVLTEDRSYLVAVATTSGSRAGFDRYNPDTDTWDHFDFASGAGNLQVKAFVHDGLVFAAFCGSTIVSSKIWSFDPVTGAALQYPNPNVNTLHRSGEFFSLHDRLFLSTVYRSNAAGEDSMAGKVLEFSFGIWSDTGIDTNLGSGDSRFGKQGVLRISDSRVLLLGHGSESAFGGTSIGGLVAVSIGTVGDTSAGALELKATTQATSIAVIPLALRPNSAGYGNGGAPDDVLRVYATSVTDDPTGSIRHFIYFISNGGPPTVIPTLYEVFDDVTPMVIDPTTPEADSNFVFPEQLYGGGATSGGIDGSTRYVSCQARGWEQGNTGVRIKVSAHGDALVIAHRGIAGGPFQAGEIITGAGGGSGTLIGDGAAEGLYLRDVTGTFLTDAVITGGTSSATATINGVLLHSGVTGSALEVAETVTGGTSGASAPVTHLGLGGTGEQLIKVGTVTSGPFQSGETITGSTSGGTAVLSSAPLGSHGGAANKTIRARFNPGKGIPSGFATMVLGTGIGGTVSKGTGPSSSDELINVVADGAVGDTPVSFEWDYIADNVDEITVAQMTFEIDRI